jgi:hypothetical protein
MAAVGWGRGGSGTVGFNGPSTLLPARVLLWAATGLILGKKSILPP